MLMDLEAQQEPSSPFFLLFRPAWVPCHMPLDIAGFVLWWNNLVLEEVTPGKIDGADSPCPSMQGGKDEDC